MSDNANNARNENISSPETAKASAGSGNTVPVPEQIARLEGVVEGIKHGQLSVLGSHAVIIGAVGIAFAVMIGGFVYLGTATDSVETKLTARMDRLEQNISELPNQLVTIAQAISGRQPIVIQPAPAPPPTPPSQNSSSPAGSPKSAPN